MLNKAMLIGFIGNDIELKHTTTGQAVANLRIATSRTWKDKTTGEKVTETEWHDVEVWGKQATSCAEYVGKGSPVYVEGRIATDRWEKDGVTRSRTKIVADLVRFLPKKGVGSVEEQEDVPAAA